MGTFDGTATLLIGYKTDGVNLDNTNIVTVAGLDTSMNGFTFENDNSLFTSNSDGRYKKCKSEIVRNDLTGFMVRGGILVATNKTKIEMPKMNEEIMLDRGNLYVLFESGAQKYCNSAYNRTDRMIVLPASTWHSGKGAGITERKKASSEPAEVWDGSPKDVEFTYDYENGINETERTFSFKPEESGLYTLSVSKVENYSLENMLVATAELTDDDDYYGFAEASTDEGSSCEIFLTKGNRYSIDLTTDRAEMLDLEEYEEETGSYKVIWNAEGILGERKILKGMTDEVEFNGEVCELEAGEEYYFTSTLDEAEDDASTGIIRLTVEKQEETKANTDGTASVSGNKKDAVITYSAPETGMHKIELTSGSVEEMMVLDKDGQTIAMGFEDVMFVAYRKSTYHIALSGCSGEVTLSIKPCESDLPDIPDDPDDPDNPIPGPVINPASGGAVAVSPTVQAAGVSESGDLVPVKSIKLKAAKVESVYNTTLSEVLQKIVSLSVVPVFADEWRTLSLKEICNANDYLYIDCVGNRLLPLIDIMDNNFIAFDLGEKLWKLINIVDEIEFSESKTLDGLV